ncbi:AraC family transcriptional regulator [Acetobacter thailandicus]|uniref:Helix-turn-helix transcriptional regulator n=1 Tax=Acetobacter thailandicus TaxID=1502842 RepID=A0ABT3QDH7_9PROT|nr:helix-turn-helix transcriptional regulator [Acetobacter thailandicus]MCX2563341.1 helix-turn-helix transcriptional regulator [Acetobacter thailandicus]NHN94094.1 helix-turn-helix domain-containing protein [Acetobacter thailandicus]
MLPSQIAPEDFDPDTSYQPAIALSLEFTRYELDAPAHTHRKGQLILALHGAVTFTAANGIWIVPPNCGVWVPGGVVHSNRATDNAHLAFLFVEPGAAALPDYCCTLGISAIVREMILHLAGLSSDYSANSHTARLVRVLLDELTLMPEERLNLPVSDHPKVREIAKALTSNPADRATMAIWAERVALSERSLARLIVQETGLTFGRWRQQLQLIIALRELAKGVAVQKVSEALGYESVTAFIQMFKKALGKTPARYFEHGGQV